MQASPRNTVNMQKISMNLFTGILKASKGISQVWDPNVLSKHWAKSTFYLKELTA